MPDQNPVRKMKDEDFCSYLLRNDDSNMKRLMNATLIKLDSTDQVESKISALKKWLEAQPCITGVKDVKGWIETRIPVKVFELYYEKDGKPLKATMDFNLEKGVLRFAKLN